jgi:hypothetical protein
VAAGSSPTSSHGRFSCSKPLLPYGDPERWRERLKDQLGQRAATEKDIATAVFFLALDRAGYTGGEVLVVGGGMCSRRTCTD